MSGDTGSKLHDCECGWPDNDCRSGAENVRDCCMWRNSAAPEALMTCGHPQSMIVTGDEGTSYCQSCEEAGRTLSDELCADFRGVVLAAAPEALTEPGVPCEGGGAIPGSVSAAAPETGRTLEQALDHLQRHADGVSNPWFWLTHDDARVLLAELDRLRGERDGERARVRWLTSVVENTERDRDKAEAENVRYWDAPTRIASNEAFGGAGTLGTGWADNEARQRMRTAADALAGGEQEQT